PRHMNQTQQKYTVDQFGAMIKEKYPQYAKFSDNEIGSKTLEAHPEYSDRVQHTQVGDSAVINSTAGMQPTDPQYKPSDRLAEAGVNGVGSFMANNIREAGSQLATEFGGGPNSVGSRLIEDVKAGAADIEAGIKGNQPGVALKGLVKAGARTAGDVAGAVF